MECSVLAPEDEEEYPAFLKRCGTGTFFQSLPYRNVLADTLRDSEHMYLVAKSEGRIIAALPLFIQRGCKYEPVINSLPFFGSNGGFLGSEKGWGHLKQTWLHIAKEEGCVASTLISSYRERHHENYAGMPYHHIDSRESQVTTLPKHDTDTRDAILYNVFAKRARNAVTKAERGGLIIHSSKHFAPLYRIQQQAIEGRGRAKPYEFYSSISKHFSDDDYMLLYAEKEGEIIAGLLTFYFGDTVEYFSPATHPDYRNEQAMSLLIYEAMKDAIARGFTKWNWGGIKRTPQKESLYMFKQSFGAQCVNRYKYFTTIHNSESEVFQLSLEEIAAEYEWFFVYPFDKKVSEI